MKKRNIFIITAMTMLMCASFNIVSAEETTEPVSDIVQTTEVSTESTTAPVTEDITTTTVTDITTVPETTVTDVVTTETVTTTDDSGLTVDTALMNKYYFSDTEAFSSEGMVVKYNGIDVTENSEITFAETPAIFDSQTNDYTISFNVNYSDEAASGTFTSDIKIALHGDIDLNHKINLYDVIEIAKKIIHGNCATDGTFTDFLMNTCDTGDIIDIYDAIWVAKLNMEVNPLPQPEIPEVLIKPSIDNYNVSNITGIKAYVNDCIIYRAKYHGMKEEKISFVGNEVDEWSGYSWDTPNIFISDLDYYMEQNDGLSPLSYHTSAKSLAEYAMGYVDSAVDEWKDNFYRNYDDRVELGYIDEGYTWEEDLSYSRFVVKWEDMGHDNYKVYVMW